MLKKHTIAIAAATSLCLLAAGAPAAETKASKKPAPLHSKAPVKAAGPAEVLVMDSKGVRLEPFSAAMLAEHLVLETDSFDLNQPTQEGTKGRDRLTQDEIQRLCSLGKGEQLDEKATARVSELAAASIKYPEGGIKLGDWKKGRELA